MCTLFHCWMYSFLSTHVNNFHWLTCIEDFTTWLMTFCRNCARILEWLAPVEMMSKYSARHYLMLKWRWRSNCTTIVECRVGVEMMSKWPSKHFSWHQNDVDGRTKGQFVNVEQILTWCRNGLLGMFLCRRNYVNSRNERQFLNVVFGWRADFKILSK